MDHCAIITALTQRPWLLALTALFALLPWSIRLGRDRRGRWSGHMSALVWSVSFTPRGMHLALHGLRGAQRSLLRTARARLLAIRSQEPGTRSQDP